MRFRIIHTRLTEQLQHYQIQKKKYFFWITIGTMESYKMPLSFKSLTEAEVAIQQIIQKGEIKYLIKHGKRIIKKLEIANKNKKNDDKIYLINCDRIRIIQSNIDKYLLRQYPKSYMDMFRFILYSNTYKK